MPDPMPVFPQTRSCFACGHENPIGLDLTFQRDGDQIHTRWIPSTHHTGFAETVHGGLIATVLDEIMAWTCGVLGGRFAYSVDINIRYTHPLIPGTTATGVGTLIENRKKKIFRTEARLLHEDQEIAHATGKYLAVKTDVEERLWNEFGPDAAVLKQLRTS